MLRDPFLKTLRDQARSLLLWAAALAAYVALLMTVYPSIRDSAAEMQGYIDSLPEAFKAAFLGPDVDFSKPAGYVNTEILSWLAPIVLIAFAVTVAARSIAGEEEDGTLGLVLAYPVTRVRILLHKFAAFVALTGLLGAAFWLALFVATEAMGMSIGAGVLAQAVVLLTLLGLACGSVAFAVGAGTGRRSAALASGAGVALAMYLLNTLAGINDAVEPYRVLSLFHYVGAPAPLGHGLGAGDVAVFVGVTLALLVAALALFVRRDVRV